MRYLSIVKRIAVLLFTLFAVLLFLLNQKYEVFPFRLSSVSSNTDLKVLTWNVHCSSGAHGSRQQKIAEVILREDADFVLLNEFHQDSCSVIDSILKVVYPYTEEYQSRTLCGDIFYSKRKMTNSGHPILRELWESQFAQEGEQFPDSLIGKSIQAIKATIAIGDDSVQIFGMHAASNSWEGSGDVGCLDSTRRMVNLFHRYKAAQVIRCTQSRWTCGLIVGSSHPVIVMGDMNDFSRSKPLNILRSGGLKNAWWEGGNGYGCTFKKGWMRLRIDHILYDERLKLVNIKVIDTELSDHNPIVAEFSMN